MRVRQSVAAAVIGVISMAGPVMAQCSWSALGSGLNAPMQSLAVFDDGNGPALYAGGEFTMAGGVGANHIAKWDGSGWAPLGSGTNAGVNALAVYDDGNGPALYAAGGFTMAGGVTARAIAKWDGTQWSSLDSSFNGPVYALTVFNDGSGPALYVGGHFSQAGPDVPANNIAKWNATVWAALDVGTNNDVRALSPSADGTLLYSGGLFTMAGGNQALRIAQWDGTQWGQVGGGMDNFVFALTIYDDGTGAGAALYAGGVFTTAGGMPANNIAKWDGTIWSPLGLGTDDVVWALSPVDAGLGPLLYVGGAFFHAGGQPANHVASWNGAQWSPLGSGMNATAVYALAGFDDGAGQVLFAGGEFTTAGGSPASNVARWGCGR